MIIFLVPHEYIIIYALCIWAVLVIEIKFKILNVAYFTSIIKLLNYLKKKNERYLNENHYSKTLLKFLKLDLLKINFILHYNI